MPTIQAHAKINWALNITGSRDDGYHLMDMLMQSIDLADDLTVEPAEGLALAVDGAPAGEENLVLRAAMALNRFAGTSCGASMALTKRVPARAGLGGGSADCAAAMIALSALWGLNIPDKALLQIGEKLGADVPFCLTGGLARVTGIGEHIHPIDNPPEIPLVLVRPGGGLSTAAVFRLWDEGGYPAVRLDVPALADAVLRRDLAAVDELCANALAKYGDKIEVVFCNNDGMALGAATAIQTAGRKVGEDIYLLGVDALPEAIDLIRDGDMTGTVLNDHIGQSHAAVDVAVKLLNGEAIENYYWVDYVMVNKAYVEAM